MAEGRLVHQPADAGRSVVIGPYVYDAPLLPYEKQLIATIGCSEEEYRWFVGEAIKRGRQRPAGYEHIPDIRCDAVVTPILVNLAIGLVLTGVSYLLTPKPRAPKGAEDPRTQQQLDSIRGGNRFTPSNGFDSIAELADYNSPIPIIFGLYNETENVGGLLVSPRLVWSRVFSYGRQQAVKLMFAVGEQGKADNTQPDGILPPDLSGIFIGTNALDSIYNQSFAFYWKQNTTVSGYKRIRNKNRIYGTGGSLSAADPNNGRWAYDDDVYLCPTRTGDFERGFCHAYSPSNSIEFGAYAPIPNGSVYRINWRNVSKPRIPGAKDDPEDRLDAERVKISGQSDMEGIGRNYSRRMGVIAHNGSTLSGALKSRVSVQVNDTITFLISDSALPSDFYDDKVSVEDINTFVENEQVAADDQLQVGELFSIGSTIWQVTSRSIARFEPGKGDQVIELKCIDTSEAEESIIGLVNPKTVVNPERGYVSGSAPDDEEVGAGWYPLTRLSKGLVRNNRACDVTEFGLKSTVFQKLNGICNFMSLPSPGQLADADEKSVTIVSGTITSYIKRSSAFVIYVRRAGLDASNNEFPYQLIPIYFVVVGNKPIAQYNFIRIHHPRETSPIEYEYKFVPRNGSDLARLPDATEFVLLNAATSSEASPITKQVSIASYGTFKVYTTGDLVSKTIIDKNKEFFNNVRRITEGATAPGFPRSISVNTFLPNEEDAVVSTLASVEVLRFVSEPLSATRGRMAAFAYEAFGDPDLRTDWPLGTVRQLRTKEYVLNDRWVEFEFDVVRQELPETHYARVNNGQQTTWIILDGELDYAPQGIRVVGSSTNWTTLSTFEIRRGLGNTSILPNGTSNYSTSNPFVTNRGEFGNLEYSGWQLKAVSTSSSTLVQGRSQGYYYEIFGSAASGALGRTAFRTLDLTSLTGGDRIRIELRSRTYESSGHWSGQTRFWTPPEITIIEDIAYTDKTWVIGEEFNSLVTVTAGNPFAQHYAVQGIQIGVQYAVESVSIEDLPSEDFSADRAFELQSQYVDLSLYGDLVQKSNESEPEHSIAYVNEIIDNDPVANYERMTISGLVLRASRNFTQMDQMRVWLESGIPVQRLHPDASSYNDPLNSTNAGPSNLFTDLVFYLLTNYTAGAGALLNMSAANPVLINTDDFETTSKFLRANKLFCNGAITDKVNLREFIASNAPNFLCNFVLSNGKFSLKPAVPTNVDGSISLSPVEVKQIFTSGNILENSFEVEYLSAEERRRFTASIRFRQERRNKLPEERTINVGFASDGNSQNPVESFDLTQFCTSESHAFLVAKYFLALRELVTHTIRFSTTASGLDLAPGNLIRVVTEASPYSAANNGTVSDTGIVTSATGLADGTYSVLYYKTGSIDVESGQMQVSEGRVADSNYFGVVFTVQQTTNSQNIYLVEQITFEEDATVKIVASEYPCYSDQSSKLARLITEDGSFTRFPFE